MSEHNEDKQQLDEAVQVLPALYYGRMALLTAARAAQVARAARIAQVARAARAARVASGSAAHIAKSVSTKGSAATSAAARAAQVAQAARVAARKSGSWTTTAGVRTAARIKKTVRNQQAKSLRKQRIKRDKLKNKGANRSGGLSRALRRAAFGAALLGGGSQNRDALRFGRAAIPQAYRSGHYIHKAHARMQARWAKSNKTMKEETQMLEESALLKVMLKALKRYKNPIGTEQATDRLLRGTVKKYQQKETTKAMDADMKKILDKMSPKGPGSNMMEDSGEASTPRNTRKPRTALANIARNAVNDRQQKLRRAGEIQRKIIDEGEKNMPPLPTPKNEIDAIEYEIELGKEEIKRRRKLHIPPTFYKPKTVKINSTVFKDKNKRGMN